MEKVTVEQLLIHGVPREFHDVGVTSFPGDPNAFRKILDFRKNLQKNLRAGAGLYLYGPNGTGKTACASLIVRSVLELGHTAHLYRWSRLLEDRGRTFSSMGAEEFNYQVFGVNLLVIDDLGKEMKAGGDFSVSTLDWVLRERHSCKRSTVITSNAEPSSVRATYGNSIGSLLNAVCQPVLFEGSDMRISEVES